MLRIHLLRGAAKPLSLPSTARRVADLTPHAHSMPAGIVLYVPDEDGAGVQFDSFDYLIRVGSTPPIDSNVTTLVVTVNEVDDLPRSVSTSVAFDEDTRSSVPIQRRRRGQARDGWGGEGWQFQPRVWVWVTLRLRLRVTIRVTNQGLGQG